MKKIMVLILAISIIVSLSGCSQRANGEAQNAQQTQSDIPQKEADTTASPDETDAQSETNNILITYFAVAENSEVDAISSASVRVIDGEAKGNIRVLADVIQSNIGGDMFSIQTSVEYPAGIMELIDYADKEQEENKRPELTSQIENLDDYDVIFIGYPNWWYDLPMVMYSFFEEYDFSGKTIIPFCTHNGSRFSNTINTIRELEPDATVLDGFTINFEDVEDVNSDVAKWISELGI